MKLAILGIPVVLIAILAVSHATLGSRSVRYGEELRQLENEKQSLLVQNRTLQKELSMVTSIGSLQAYVDSEVLVPITQSESITVSSETLTSLGY